MMAANENSEAFLIHASESGQIEKIKLYLEQGANIIVEVENSQGDFLTPLKHAEMNGNTEVLLLLQDKEILGSP